MISDTLQDLRFSLRGFVRQPGFTIVAVLVLAAGIGANTGVISVARAVTLGALPYPDSDRLVAIFSTNADDGVDRMNAALPIVRDWQAQASTFEAWATVWSPVSVVFSDAEGPARLSASVVSPSLFSLAGAEAAAGRLLDAGDDVNHGEHPVVVLGHELWRSRFGSDPAVVGRPIVLDGVPYEVVGVLEAGFVDFRSPEQVADIWLPRAMSSRILGADADVRTTRIFTTLARLRAGATQQQARAEMSAISGRLAERYPDTDEGWDVDLVPLRDLMLGTFETPLATLAAGAFFLLVVGCANVANLLLLRTTARRRELATRLALGATTSRVARLLVIETIVLIGLGGAVGFAAAAAGTEAAVRSSPIALPPFVDVAVDGGVLALAVGLTLVVGLGAVVGPLLLRSRSRWQGALGAGKGLDLGGRDAVVRKALVVAEVAVAALLLVGAGLLVRSLERLQATDVGFDPEATVALQVEVPNETHDAGELRSLARGLIDEIESVPGVVAAHVWSPMVPGQSSWYTAVRPQDRPNLRDDELPLVRFHYVGPDAMKGLGLRFVAGRDIGPSDRADSDGVIVLSESAAASLWPGQDAIGRVVRRWNRPEWLTVIGVVEDARQGGRRGDDARFHRDVYFAYLQEPQYNLVMLSRIEGDAGAALDEVRAAARRAAPALPVFDVATLESRMATQDAIPAFTASLAVAFAAAAMLLAVLGLYGVVAYGVARRTREIGLRMALGARPESVLAGVARQTLVLAGTGLLVGLGVGLIATRWIAALLYEVSPTDLGTFALAAMLLLAVCAVAAILPARRAARVDPMVALRLD